MNNSRPTAVAGSFYPDDPKQLRQQLNHLLTDLPCPAQTPKALIVPHAGYYYSGRVAAYAYALLKTHAYKRIILLGPSHRCYLQGCALSAYSYFDTPLGQLKIDNHNSQKLLELGLARQYESAHIQEHSLEVQLPFIRHLLKDAEILPIVVGVTEASQVSAILSALANLTETLVVISTDLSHFHPYDQAKQIDADTIAQILAFKGQLTGEQACGCYSVNGLLHYAKAQNWQCQLLNHANSGDINHSKNEVVGYASFILF